MHFNINAHENEFDAEAAFRIDFQLYNIICICITKQARIINSESLLYQWKPEHIFYQYLNKLENIRCIYHHNTCKINDI